MYTEVIQGSRSITEIHGVHEMYRRTMCTEVVQAYRRTIQIQGSAGVRVTYTGVVQVYTVYVKRITPFRMCLAPGEPHLSLHLKWRRICRERCRCSPLGRC
jgi:putative heme degradation protein